VPVILYILIAFITSVLMVGKDISLLKACCSKWEISLWWHAAWSLLVCTGVTLGKYACWTEQRQWCRFFVAEIVAVVYVEL